MFNARGQMDYVRVLQKCYLNKSSQSHCLPSYAKWADLYCILCSVNYSEVIEGDLGDGLVRSYGALCYHTVVHSKVFEIFASIYQSLAYGVINRMGLSSSQFGQFYTVMAYRHLLKGHFKQLFDHIKKGMEMHRMFGEGHHYRECLNVRGWIEFILGLPSTSSESFRQLYELADMDSDNYGKIWASLGVVANSIHLGLYSQAADYLERYAFILVWFVRVCLLFVWFVCVCLLFVWLCLVVCLCLFVFVWFVVVHSFLFISFTL